MDLDGEMGYLLSDLDVHHFLNANKNYRQVKSLFEALSRSAVCLHFYPTLKWFLQHLCLHGQLLKG